MASASRHIGMKTICNLKAEIDMRIEKLKEYDRLYDDFDIRNELSRLQQNVCLLMNEYRKIDVETLTSDTDLVKLYDFLLVEEEYTRKMITTFEKLFRMEEDLHRKPHEPYRNYSDFSNLYRPLIQSVSGGSSVTYEKRTQLAKIANPACNRLELAKCKTELAKLKSERVDSDNYKLKHENVIQQIALTKRIQSFSKRVQPREEPQDVSNERKELKYLEENIKIIDPDDFDEQLVILERQEKLISSLWDNDIVDDVDLS